MYYEWASLRLFDPLDGVRVVEPLALGKGNWAGAPNVWLDETGDFWFVNRLRKPHSHRGYLLCIPKSSDGVHFTTVLEVTKDQLGTESMER